MKLCDVTQFYSPKSGGVRRYLMEKRRYIAAQTEDEHHLVIPGERTEYVQEGRLHTLTVASPRVDRTSRYRILLKTPVVRDYLRRMRPDLIEAGDPYHLAWSVLHAGRELGVPVIGFYHSHFPDAYLRTLLKYCGSHIRDMGMALARSYIVHLYRRFDATLVPSEKLSALLREWGVPRAVPVKLGVDTNAFTPGPRDWEIRRKMGVPDDAFLLLYVGRLAGEKNVATLLAAFELLKKRPGERKYWLAILGDGPLRRLLPAVRRETHSLYWHSFVNGSAELARYYRAADLFVHPGTVETFGLVALETQACGLPLVGIRGSSMDANITAGLDLWSPRNTPEDLADAVERGAAANLPGLGALVAERTAARFSWPVVFGEMWGHYREVIARHRAGSRPGKSH